MSTVTQNEAERGATMTTSIIVPKELWKRVKTAAVEHETSAAQLCADGLELILKQLDKKKSR